MKVWLNFILRVTVTLGNLKIPVIYSKSVYSTRSSHKLKRSTTASVNINRVHCNLIYGEYLSKDLSGVGETRFAQQRNSSRESPRTWKSQLKSSSQVLLSCRNTLHGILFSSARRRSCFCHLPLLFVSLKGQRLRCAKALWKQARVSERGTIPQKQLHKLNFSL